MRIESAFLIPHSAFRIGRSEWSEIKDRVDLAAVATNLLGPAPKRQGPRLLWPCPFHDDHDPSFQVDWNRKTWRCWVCAIGGDAAELVKKVNKCDFPTAVKFLADLAGVASPSRGATGPPACRGGPPTPARGPASIVSKPAHPVPGARPPDEPSGLSCEKRRPSLTRPPLASGDQPSQHARMADFPRFFAIWLRLP